MGNQENPGPEIEPEDFTNGESADLSVSGEKQGGGQDINIRGEGAGPDKKPEDYKDKYIRLCAEFDNTRKRYDRERAEFVKYANEGLLVQFLSVMDDLDRTVQAAKAQHQDYQAFLKGIEMVMGRVHDLLKRSNVKPIEAVGKAFDPHYHEILMQVESDDLDHATVVEEFQKGYCLGDKVIRTSKVKVAVRKETEAAAPDFPPEDGLRDVE